MAKKSRVKKLPRAPSITAPAIKKVALAPNETAHATGHMPVVVPVAKDVVQIAPVRKERVKKRPWWSSLWD
jgi:hypothetical protein